MAGTVTAIETDADFRPQLEAAASKLVVVDFFAIEVYMLVKHNLVPNWPLIFVFQVPLFLISAVILHKQMANPENQNKISRCLNFNSVLVSSVVDTVDAGDEALYNQVYFYGVSRTFDVIRSFRFE